MQNAMFPACPNRNIALSQFNETLSPTSGMLIEISSFLLAIIALIGNILSILVIYRKISLHNPSGILISSLAISNIIVTLITALPAVFHFNSKTYSKSLVGCIIHAYLITATIGISYSMVSIIAMDRCLAVSLPLHYEIYVTKRRTIYVIIINCLSVAIASALPLMGLQHLGLGQYNYIPYLSGCWLDITNYCKNFKFVILVYCSVTIVLLLVFICYVIICVVAIQSGSGIPIIPNATQEKRQILRKSIRTTLLIVSIFLITMTPSAIIVLATITQGRLIVPPQIYKFLLHWSIYTNIVINPFIFGFSHKDFRQSYRKMISVCIIRRRVHVRKFSTSLIS